MLKKRKALNHVTFGKLLIIILAFWLFLLVNFVSLDAATTADVPGFGKILKRMPNCVQKTIFERLMVLQNVVLS